MRITLVSFILALSLPACVTDDARRDVGVIIDPTHLQDAPDLARRPELAGIATPESEYYCDVDSDCGPGLTCISQRHTCFDERGRLDEADVPLGTVEPARPRVDGTRELPPL
ncbi:MAG TPA: hypothetical protein VFQ65_18470 [Kofleriaceae bacterium]|nr:hypothetical protein [Kofleriaceae bacterium]